MLCGALPEKHLATGSKENENALLPGMIKLSDHELACLLGLLEYEANGGSYAGIWVTP